MANISAKALEVTRLWRGAEGHAPALDALGMTRNRAQLAFSESVAKGEIGALVPALKTVVAKVYDETETVADKFTTRKTVQGIDVREKVKIISFGDQANIPDVNAGDQFIAGGLPSLLPREKYPQIGFTSGEKEIWAGKLGEAFGIDWEAIVNSRGAEVDLIRESFTAFGTHAKNQEDIDVAKTLVTSAGVNLATDGTGIGGAFPIPGNPSLSDPLELQKAIQAVMNLSVAGQPVHYTKYFLVTTTQNVPVAKQTLATTRATMVPARTGTGSDKTSAQYEQVIDFGVDIEVVGFKWLNRIFAGMAGGWFLIPDTSGDSLPALTSNYLAGYETPSLWIKDSNAKNASGGVVNVATEGDFDSDSIHTKVRHVHGANGLWTGGIGYSTGAGV